MSLPRYSEYKDSGVEWLGAVPGYWTVAPLKRSFQIVGGSTPKSEQETYWDGEIVWVTPSDLSKLSSIGINDSQRKITTEGLVSCGTTLVPFGSIVLSTRAPIGSLAIAETELCTNQGCKSLVPFADIQSRFYGYLLSISTGELNIRGKGTTFLELSGDELGAFKVGVPPNVEQQTIATFLDRETGKIDALIAEQRRLVELLAEKRQAVISHAVTKGLNPNAKMKDSGIEWLGEVPEHWGRAQVGRVCKQVSDGPHFSPNYVDEGVMFLSARNIGVESWHLDDAKYISEVDYLEFCRRVIPEIGDVLYTKGGTTGIARVVDLEDRFQVWVHVAVLKVDHDLIDPYYLAYALNSVGCYEQSQLHTRGATNQDLGLTRMTKIWFALPPLAEQLEIRAFLHREAAVFDTLTTEANRAIELLQERRSALISAAVTGKIDVRENG